MAYFYAGGKEAQTNHWMTFMNNIAGVAQPADGFDTQTTFQTK
jgi:hypothetical protein